MTKILPDDGSRVIRHFIDDVLWHLGDERGTPKQVQAAFNSAATYWGKYPVAVVDEPDAWGYLLPDEVIILLWLDGKQMTV